MKFKLSNKSKDNLKGVHPDLVFLVYRALQLSEVDFGITEGLRSKERQQTLVSEGKSLTMNSRHITGHAVDVVGYSNGKVSWDFEIYEKISEAFKTASKEMGYPVVWGGDWKTLKDGPHFELDKRYYP